MHEPRWPAEGGKSYRRATLQTPGQWDRAVYASRPTPAHGYSAIEGTGKRKRVPLKGPKVMHDPVKAIKGMGAFLPNTRIRNGCREAYAPVDTIPVRGD